METAMTQKPYALPDFNRWEEIIHDPLWYKTIVPEFSGILALRNKSRKAYKEARDLAYSFFESHLLNGTIALGKTGTKWDAERKPIDTAVIHHTSNPPGITPLQISAIELIRLYATQYAKKEVAEPIYSAHFRDDIQVFYPYHWLVRRNGQTEQLLLDHEIGWHAGDWDVNCRSIAICLDDDLENRRPTGKQLAAVARLISQYESISKEGVLGHCEVNSKTTCPSKRFLSREEKPGWKEDLLAML